VEEHTARALGWHHVPHWLSVIEWNELRAHDNPTITERSENTTKGMKQRKYVLDNLLTLLKGDDGRLRNIYIDNLPNVKNFKIITQGENIPMTALNISKKVKSHLEVEVYKNKKINRYIEHQVLRLKKYRLNPTKYWSLAFTLLKKSVS